MENDELFVDDVFDQPKKKKKGVDGKSKGDRTELNLCKLLGKHFGTEFTKAPGSGALATIRENLPDHAKKTLTGDLCVPDGFRWVIECKGGYEDKIDLNGVLDGSGIAKLDDFVQQSSRDAEYCGRKPIICWKRNFKPWLCMIQDKEMPPHDFQYKIRYKDWWMVQLEELLQNTERDFWFNG